MSDEERDVSNKMMNLTLHVQKEREVELVKKETDLDLERSPQGVFVGTGEEGLAEASSEVIAKVKREGYKHILVGGSTGLVARLVQYITKNDLGVSLYEFENSRRREQGTNKPIFEPVAVRKVV